MVALLVALAAASASTTSTSAKAAGYRTRLILRRDASCARTVENCPYIKLQYPEFTSAPNRAARDALNGAVTRFLLQPVLEDGRFESVDALVSDFIGRAAAAKRATPDAPAYLAEKVVTVALNTAGVISMGFGFFWFTGGAHPNHATDLASYALAAGRKLGLSELLVPGYAARLNAIAERIFRKQKELPQGADVEAAGFSFPGGRFRLNDNFMIGRDGLVFYYNNYEIAAYVVGPTELIVPYAQIRGLVKPGSLLASVMQARP